MSKMVRITDVSPRDGLQNEPLVIPFDRKVRLIDLLSRTGVDEIEVTSFVSPKWVPQLADAEEVAEGIVGLYRAETVFSALVPNERGLERVLAINEEAGFPLIGKVAVFTAASETFSMRNTNATIEQTIERFRPVVAGAKEAGLAVRGYISCAVACPFEEAISPDKPRRVADLLRELGIEEIDLGDTIGVAHPADIAALLGAFGDDLDSITLHLHDTFGRAADCVRTALEMGVRSFDGSAGGLGGCPYASKPGAPAPGNISTTRLIEAVREAGYETNIDLEALAEASEYAGRIVAESRDGSVRP